MRNRENGEQQTTATCPNCGGTITFDPDKEIMAKCPYCDQSFKVSDLLHETEKEHVERMRARQESEKINFQREQMNFAREQMEKQEKKERAQAFRKSGWRKFFTFCAVIAFLILLGELFGANRSVGGIALSLLICFLYVLYFLMGFQSVKEPFNGFHNILAILALMLVFAYGAVTPESTTADSKEADEAEVIDWDEDVVLHDHLPAPTSLKADISLNDENAFDAYLYDFTEETFDAYVDACKDMGYTLGSSSFEGYYRAESADYYELYLNLYEDENRVFVSLNAPGEITDITWPESGAGALLPVPEISPLQGSLDQESSSTYDVMLVNVTASDFTSYISACQAAGFTEDYYKSSDRYRASDADGNDLELRYDSAVKTMDVYVDAD